MSKSRLSDILNLAYVPRWSIIPINQPQSVAEHSFNVAAITMQLFDAADDVTDRYLALRWAIHHDAAECVSSDLPRPFKTAMGSGLRGEVVRKAEEGIPWFRGERPSIRIEALVSVADTAEAIIWAADHVLPRVKFEVVRGLVRRLDELCVGYEYNYRPIRGTVFGLLKEVLHFDIGGAYGEDVRNGGKEAATGAGSAGGAGRVQDDQGRGNGDGAEAPVPGGRGDGPDGVAPSPGAPNDPRPHSD